MSKSGNILISAIRGVLCPTVKTAYTVLGRGGGEFDSEGRRISYGRNSAEQVPVAGYTPAPKFSRGNSRTAVTVLGAGGGEFDSEGRNLSDPGHTYGQRRGAAPSGGSMESRIEEMQRRQSEGRQRLSEQWVARQGYGSNDPFGIRKQMAQKRQQAAGARQSAWESENAALLKDTPELKRYASHFANNPKAWEAWKQQAGLTGGAQPVAKQAPARPAAGGSAGGVTGPGGTAKVIANQPNANGGGTATVAVASRAGSSAASPNGATPIATIRQRSAVQRQGAGQPTSNPAKPRTSPTVVARGNNVYAANGSASASASAKPTVSGRPSGGVVWKPGMPIPDGLSADDAAELSRLSGQPLPQARQQPPASTAAQGASAPTSVTQATKQPGNAAAAAPAQHVAAKPTSPAAQPGKPQAQAPAVQAPKPPTPASVAKTPPNPRVPGPKVVTDSVASNPYAKSVASMQASSAKKQQAAANAATRSQADSAAEAERASRARYYNAFARSPKYKELAAMPEDKRPLAYNPIETQSLKPKAPAAPAVSSLPSFSMYSKYMPSIADQPNVKGVAGTSAAPAPAPAQAPAAQPAAQPQAQPQKQDVASTQEEQPILARIPKAQPRTGWTPRPQAPTGYGVTGWSTGVTPLMNNLLSGDGAGYEVMPPAVKQSSVKKAQAADVPDADIMRLIETVPPEDLSPEELAEFRDIYADSLAKVQRKPLEQTMKEHEGYKTWGDKYGSKLSQLLRSMSMHDPMTGASYVNPADAEKYYPKDMFDDLAHDQLNMYQIGANHIPRGAGDIARFANKWARPSSCGPSVEAQAARASHDNAWDNARDATAERDRRILANMRTGVGDVEDDGPMGTVARLGVGGMMGAGELAGGAVVTGGAGAAARAAGAGMRGATALAGSAAGGAATKMLRPLDSAAAKVIDPAAQRLARIKAWVTRRPFRPAKSVPFSQRVGSAVEGGIADVGRIGSKALKPIEWAGGAATHGTRNLPTVGEGYRWTMNALRPGANTVARVVSHPVQAAKYVAKHPIAAADRALTPVVSRVMDPKLVYEIPLAASFGNNAVRGDYGDAAGDAASMASYGTLSRLLNPALAVTTVLAPTVYRNLTAGKDAQQ